MLPLWGEASLAGGGVLAVDGIGVLKIFGVIDVILEGGLMILVSRDVLGIACVFFSTESCCLFASGVISVLFASSTTGLFLICSYWRLNSSSRRLSVKWCSGSQVLSNSENNCHLTRYQATPTSQDKYRLRFVCRGSPLLRMNSTLAALFLQSLKGYLQSARFYQS
jgi:hypothetical protein